LPESVLHHSTASTTRREASSIPVSAISLTAFAFAPGELNTTTPRSASLSTGMLLTPAPARATQWTLSGMSISCMFALRTMIASGFSAYASKA